jgi:hypothetical protein
MKKIAVVGAGIFGSEIAIQLANQGHEVILFEKKSDILLEATANSQNRLHLGLHYPRDLETAIQSRDGYTNFTNRFPTSVRNNFPNYYVLARNESKVSLEEFEEFVKQARIEITSVEEVPELELVSSKLIKIWKCNEGVIDIDTLRNLLRKDLNKNGVEVQYDTEITKCLLNNSKWTVVSPEEKFFGFDSVIRTTYGLDHIESNVDSITDREYEYHHTMVLEVKSKNPTVGMTVVDGDFITLLPKGFTNDYLLYAPKLSVRAKFQGSRYPIEWKNSTNIEFNNMEAALLSRALEWFPSFDIEGKSKRNITIRSIQPNVSSTDKRTSQVREMAQGFYDVWSGKIDHCVEVSQDISRRISKQ